MQILNLHNHSSYSINDGVGTPEQWAKHISQNKNKYAQALSLSEHGTFNGMMETYNAAKKYNLKYVPSMEIYLADKFDAKDKKQERLHLLLFAINKRGLQQLILINNLAIQRGQIFKSRTGKKYTIVTIDILKEIIQNEQNNLKAAGACIGGYWYAPIAFNDNVQLAKERLLTIINIFGKDNTYLEYQTFNDAKQIKVNYVNRMFKKHLKLKSIITSDAHILQKDNTQYQAMAMAMGWKITLKKYLDIANVHETIFFKDYETFQKDIKQNNLQITEEELYEACQNTLHIYEEVQSFSLLKEQKFIYHGYTKEQKLQLIKKLLQQGWNRKIKNVISNNQLNKYKERLQYEMKVLLEKEFIDYFLAVEEIMRKGREQNIVFGVGRGSAASSLVSYLLNITNLDPLKYNLIFERFISANRTDYPDIDVDVSQREKVIDLIQQLYPNYDVTVIANKGKFGIKNLINNIFKVLNIAYPKNNYVTSGLYYSELIEKYGIGATDIDAYMQLQEVKQLNKYLTDKGFSLEKMLRLFINNLFSIGVHAGGVCILPKNQCDVPLTPVSNDKYPYGTGLSESGTYRELEDVGQIKFDFLGIRTLRIFEEVIKMLYENNEINDKEKYNLLTYNNIDVEDENVYLRINTQLTDGFFQIGSKGMKNLIGQLQPHNIEDLAQLIALYRPGPLKAKMDKTIKQVKDNPKKIHELWPDDLLPYIKDIIKPTSYHILYQEQIMFIGQAIGNYNSADLNDFRKFVSKGYVIQRTNPQKFKALQQKFYNAFVDNGLKKGISQESLQQLWDKMKKFASYSFVKSHSVSYSYNAFMCAYLAFYYPIQWYTAVLRHEDPIEFVPIVKEQIKQLQYNITIKPPKLNYTVAIPTIVNNDIVLGISQIKGIGPKAAEELKHIRTNYKSFNEFIQSDKYSKRIVNKGVINKLIQIGFFDDVENGINKIQIRRNLLIQYNKKKMKKKDAEKITKNNYLQIIFNYSGDEKLFYYQSELQMLGVAVSEFPYIKLVNRIHSFMKYDNKKYYYNHTEPLMQIISSIEGIKIKKTKTKKTYVSLNMRTIDGKIIWVNVFDRSIKEMYKKWKIDLMQGKQYKNNWFLFYYSENGNWKNFINLVPLKFFIKNNSSIINIKE